MAVIGIDLGTTYSAAAQFVDGETEIIYIEGRPTLPSVVGVDRRGRIVIGHRAKRNQADNPQDTIVEIKRKMGKKGETVMLGGQQRTPQEISSLILRRIRELAEEELGEPVTGAVISCPAYFMDEPRHATKEAGELAGLNVLRIVNEPTAAAYAYGLLQDEPDKERLVMVYDLGGGTFDVTVLKMLGGSVEVIGTGGDPELGGSNFDDRIVDWMVEQLEETDPEFLASLSEGGMEALKTRLKFHAEEGKMILCGPPPRDAHHFAISQIGKYEGRPVSFEGTLTMEEFERRIDDLMQGSIRHLDEAMTVPKEKHKYTEEHLTDILLVGGSTRVPYVRKLLEERYPHVPLRGLESGINPDEIVARGASIVAAQVDPDSEELVESQLIDVTGHTLSVAVFEERLGHEILFPLIPKETPIPTSAKHHFASAGQMAPYSKVRIYQGEGEEITPEVMMIGEFIIEIQPRMEHTPLEIGLDLDANGLLVAHATDMLTTRQVKCEINYDDSAQIPQEELDRKRAELEATMKQRMARAENPLDGVPGAPPAPPSGWTQPQPPAQPVEPVPPPPPAGPPGDPLATMNPIVYDLYQRAIQNFARIPPDRQPVVMQLVGEIGQAAQAGDQTKVMELGLQLQQQVSGLL
jgi:molecular chaperone DnaK